VTDNESGETGRTWWADVAAVGGLLVALLVTGMLVQTLRIFGNSSTATGSIYEKYIAPGDSEGPPIWHFRYSFRDASGREQRGLASVTSRIYERTSVGSPLEIQYEADDPGNNRVISDTGIHKSSSS
jgi:hypothetical protein